MTIYAYSHTETSLQSIEAGLSTSRLKKYLDYADGDLEKAIELHSWNCALGASLHIPIQHFELILRNACDRELQSIFGQPDWFNVLPTGPIPKPVVVTKKKSLRVVLLERFKSVREWLIGLSKPTKEVPVEITTWDYLNNEIKIVKERLSQSKRDPNNPPCIVAALSFGFWVVLFTKKLDQQFYRAGSGEGLYKLAPNQPAHKNQRYQFHARLERIKGLRNRIAHHEPLFHRNLLSAHELILTMTGFIDTDSANWIAHHSQFLEVWNNPPELTKPQLDRLRLNQTNDNYFKKFD